MRVKPWFTNIWKGYSGFFIITTEECSIGDGTILITTLLWLQISTISVQGTQKGRLSFTISKEILTVKSLTAHTLLSSSYSLFCLKEVCLSCRHHMPNSFPNYLSFSQQISTQILTVKSLPWEATCLIPFVDESIFLPHEAEMLENECLAIEESARNIISFTYLSYHSGDEDLGPLRSTLTSFSALPNNYVYSQAHEEYKDVGKHSFESKIH